MLYWMATAWQSSQGPTALHVLSCSLLSWFRGYVRCLPPCLCWLHFDARDYTKCHIHTYAHPKDRLSSRAVSNTFEKLYMYLKKKFKINKNEIKPRWKTYFSYLSSETALAPSNTQASTKPGMLILVFQAHTHTCTYIHIAMQTQNSLPRNLFRYIPVGMHTLKKQRKKKHVFHTAVLFCLQEFLFQPQERAESREAEGSWGGM